MGPAHHGADAILQGNIPHHIMLHRIILSHHATTYHATTYHTDTRRQQKPRNATIPVRRTNIGGGSTDEEVLLDMLAEAGGQMPCDWKDRLIALEKKHCPPPAIVNKVRNSMASQYSAYIASHLR